MAQTTDTTKRKASKVQVPVAQKAAWTAEEVAAMTGFGVRTIYRMVDLGQFPRSRRYSSRVYWLPGEVRKWLEEQPKAS